MKRTLRGFILGVLVAVLTVSSIAGYAANTVRIVIDGRELIPTDVNGNRVDPVIINGTTYLPVRAVANAIGKAIYWDGPEYTVYLGEMNGKLAYPTVQIEDIVSIGKDEAEISNQLTDNYGNTYSHAIEGINYVGRDVELEYLLNMKYSSLKGILYVAEGTTSDNLNGSLAVIADGKTIYRSPIMSKTSQPVNVDVNVTGYNDVVISIAGGYRICFGEAGFYQ